ncbi:MAG TPA: cbb3-type cytochrome c oxidase subunit I, partial [Acidimicrobiales bacterium]
MATIDVPGSLPPLDDALDDEITEVWEDRPRLLGFITTVDHKRIGMRYLYTSFTFFFVGGLFALVMRAQLAEPNNTLVSPNLYNQLFTMHGTTMIFLFNTPVLAGFGNYLLPLMIGARDMAFPRLNAFSYWIFLFAGLFMYSSFLVGKAPNGGWFAYTPLTGPTYSPGLNLDFWGLGVIFVGISSTAGAVNFIVTTFKMRAPGMTLNRMPMFVWSLLGMAFMIVLAFPAITVSSALLEADRLFNTAIFVPGRGGNVLLYQHLFWFWGHPEVYILFLPATGMVSMMIPVFSRRPLAGYLWIAASLMAIAFISFGVWVHHMFATGVPAQAMGFFSAASLVIALPSAVQYFAWIGTMWGGKVILAPPMLFALGFLVIFLLGGITGVMVAAIPFDLQVTDSYFIVAHFHYVLNGAVVFPIFGALYYWLPKMTGRMLNERLGRWSFWTMFVSFNLTFFPMHVLG